MDLLFPLIDLSVVFGVAGWVTYFRRKREPLPAAGLALSDDEGATPARSDAEGSDGQ